MLIFFCKRVKRLSSFCVVVFPLICSNVFVSFWACLLMLTCLSTLRFRQWLHLRLSWKTGKPLAHSWVTRWGAKMNRMSWIQLPTKNRRRLRLSVEARRQAPVFPAHWRRKMSARGGTRDSAEVGRRVMTTPVLRHGVYNTTSRNTVELNLQAK